MNTEFENLSPEEQERETGMLKECLNGAVPPEVEARLKGRMNDFRERMAARALIEATGGAPRRPAWRVAVAAALAAIITAFLAPLWSGAGAPTWAQVVQRFDSAPGFSASVYVKARGDAEPAQVELWMGQGGKLRLRSGNQVVFGEKGRLIDTIQIAPPGQVSDSMAQARHTIEEFIHNVGETEVFSFDTLIQALPWDGRLSAPLPMENASISHDLVVFDLPNDRGPDWIRVWALRESRLPVRMLYWNPENAASIDVALAYANPQSKDFFDPAAFKAGLSQYQTPNQTAAYELLQDIEGRPLTPHDLAPQAP